MSRFWDMGYLEARTANTLTPLLQYGRLFQRYGT